jgi:hypothetical protein
MKKLFLLILVVLSFNFLSAQVPKDGFYTYKIVYVESNGKISEMCKVLIKDNNIRVVRNAGKNDVDKKYELVVEGIIMKHKKAENGL